MAYNTGMENPNSSPLENFPREIEGEYTHSDGGSVTTQYAVLRKGAAVVDLSHKTILRLSGEKTAQMLDAVLTNEVPRAARLGVYALLLSPKGRIQTDLRLLKSGEDVLVDVEPEGATAAKESLGRYAPFYRIELEDLSEASWGILGLYGPGATDILDGLDLAEHESAEISLNGAALLAVGVAVPVPGYDLLGPASALEAARNHLRRRAATKIDIPAYERARIEAGIPRFGSDMTAENFPAEAGLLERAVSFEKGCYPGQETVARMHYRGHPNRTLYRLAIEGSPPGPGTEILQNGKRVGHLTSIAPLLVDGETLALGYLSRNRDPQEPLHTGDAILQALPRVPDHPLN